jgi:hypothetical protein
VAASGSQSPGNFITHFIVYWRFRWFARRLQSGIVLCWVQTQCFDHFAAERRVFGPDRDGAFKSVAARKREPRPRRFALHRDGYSIRVERVAAAGVQWCGALSSPPANRIDE